jgi:hypothetical protein
LTGKVIFYSAAKGEGIIITPESQKFKFSVFEWVGDSIPMVNDMVEFTMKDFKAVEIKAKDITVSKEEIAKINVDRLKEIPTKKSHKRVIEEHFKDTLELLQTTESIVKEAKIVDYTKMQRFLHTTYEHLLDKDPEFVDPKLGNIKLNLDNTYIMLKSFKQKVINPVNKFEFIYLKSNAYYMKVLGVHEESKRKLTTIKSQEGTINHKLEYGQKRLTELSPKSKEYKLIERKLKELRSLYVRISDNKEILDKRIKHTAKLIKDFLDKHKKEWIASFVKRGDELEEYLLIVLNKLAFSFDDYMWQIAKKSDSIQEFFLNSNIEGGFNSKTFLKYYLKGINKDKMNQEQKELFELQKYLDSLAKESLVIIKDDIGTDKFTYLTNHIDHFFKIEQFRLSEFMQVVFNKHIDYLIIYLSSFEKERDLFNLITRMKIINKSIDIIIVSSIFSNSFKQEAEMRNVNNLLSTQVANDKILDYLEDKIHKDS